MDMAARGHGINGVEDEVGQHFLEICHINMKNGRTLQLRSKLDGVSFFLRQVFPAETGKIPYFFNNWLD